MSDKESIIEKIRKLLRLAERAGTPEEAQAASARASQLLYKHKIERAEVGSVSEKREIAGVESEHRFNPRTQESLFYIAKLVAENFACECAFRRKYCEKKRSAVFYGWKEDAEIAKVVFENAFARILNMTRGKTPRGKEMFSKGFVLGLEKKFDEIRRENYRFAIVMKPPQEATNKVSGMKEIEVKEASYSAQDDDRENFRHGVAAGMAFNPHSTLDGQRVAGALAN